MPGKNCAVVGCGTCSVRCRGVQFFKIRQRKNLEWEQALVLAERERERDEKGGREKIYN